MPLVTATVTLALAADSDARPLYNLRRATELCSLRVFTGSC